jgi:MFS family permease
MQPARDLQHGVPLFQQQPFRMLSFTRFSSRVASNALNFALILIVVDQTGLAFMSSVLVLTLVIPSTVAGIAAGHAADTFPKRALVVAGDVLRAGVCVLFIRSADSTVACYLAAIGLATFGQFASSAEGAILPAIVTRGELTQANAIGQAVGGLAQLTGVALLTPVVLRLVNSADLLFSICGTLFVIAAAQAILIGSTRSETRREIGGRPEGRWWLTGWRQIRSDPAVTQAAIELTLISTALIIISGLIPKYIEDVLGLPVDVGAIVLSPAAVGIILGLRIANFLSHRVPHAVLSTTGFIGFVILLALVAFVREEASFLGGYGAFAFLNDVSVGQFDGAGVLAIILVMPLGFSYALVSVAGSTVLNDRVPLHLQGRVLSTQAALSALASSLPVLAAGALGDLIGVTPVMAIVAGVIGAIAALNMRPRADSPAPIRSTL